MRDRYRGEAVGRKPTALIKVNVVEHLLRKHAFISPKSLNRRLFIVQNPLQIGLLIGLQKNKAVLFEFGKTLRTETRFDRTLPAAN